jgi:hypothetical protein
MTICIAMSCESHKANIPALVLVLDTSISLGGMTSLETGVKGRQLAKFWHALIAGDDVSHAYSVIEKARSKLPEEDDEITLSELQEIFSKAYQEVRRRQIEDIFLSSFGWSLEQLMKQGNTLLPVSEFSHLLAQIQRYQLGCEFLVAGFECQNADSVEIFHVANPGVVTPQEACNFAAIGSGAPSAYTYLARREQSSTFSLAETIYNGIAAKVLAEKALGIGKETAVMIFRSDGYSAMLTSEEEIRKYGKKRKKMFGLKTWKKESRSS